MTEPAGAITPIDVAVCDSDVLWRVSHMNAVRGVNIREFTTAVDAWPMATVDHPMVVVVGPTSFEDELAALRKCGHRSHEIRLLVVADPSTGSIALDDRMEVDEIVSPRTGEAGFAQAVLALLARPEPSPTHIPSPSSSPSSRVAPSPAAARPAAARPVTGSPTSPTPASTPPPPLVATTPARLYEHIIVPFDGTAAAQEAAAVAADLARLIGASLVVMTAHDTDRPESIREVKAQAEAMSDSSVTIWVEPKSNEAKAVATMIGFRPKSLICMSTSARTGVRRATYGSMAERLLQLTDAPLLLIGPHYSGASLADLRHLVVCVDGTPTSEAAIPLAGSWAEVMPLNVTLLHVHADDHELHVDLDRLAVPLEERCKIVEKVTVDNSDVVQAILDVVGHSVSPLVVMSTHARTGLDRIVHGSVMASLIAKCTVPVLVRHGPLAVDSPKP